MKSNDANTQTELEPVQRITGAIKTIRGRKVMLDSDLAILYGVATKVLNQAVKRNPERFPDEFVFLLEPQEVADLRFQSGTSKSSRGGRRYPPYAFTEHGALMAATILNSPQAVAMSVYIIRAFIKMREEQAANAAILKRLAEFDKTLFTHDVALRDIYQKLKPLLSPPPDPPKPQIGFHTLKK